MANFEKQGFNGIIEQIWFIKPENITGSMRPVLEERQWQEAENSLEALAGPTCSS
jgi:hypothetical protein